MVTAVVELPDEFNVDPRILMQINLIPYRTHEKIKSIMVMVADIVD